MAERSGFFEFARRVQATRQGEPPAQAEGAGEPPPMTVANLTRLVAQALRSGLPAALRVKGELSNVNRHGPSGHIYFTLKDAQACLACVMFRPDAQRLRFDPEDGLEVVAGGRVSVYERQGKYQLYCTSLQPVGTGALDLAFRQLQQKLAAEGLFDPDRKRELPRYPRRVAMVTSRSTAALQDMLKVLRAYPFLELSVYHVPVQGEGAGEQIAAALRHLSAADPPGGPIDAILLARGGGSLEDLWAFNEECVARAVAASRIPVVTGIGHEIDTSIADLVADYHAHTPTEAAQVIVEGWKQSRTALVSATRRLALSVGSAVRMARQRLDAAARHELFRRPHDLVNIPRMRLDDLHRGLQASLIHAASRRQRRFEELSHRLTAADPRHRIALAVAEVSGLDRRLSAGVGVLARQVAASLEHHRQRLEAVSPQSVLRRGYSITTRKRDGLVVRSVQDVQTGDALLTRLTDGEVQSAVRDTSQLSLFE